LLRDPKDLFEKELRTSSNPMRMCTARKGFFLLPHPGRIAISENWGNEAFLTLYFSLKEDLCNIFFRRGKAILCRVYPDNQTIAFNF